MPDATALSPLDAQPSSQMVLANAVPYHAATSMMTMPTSAPEAAPLEQQVFHGNHPINQTAIELAVSFLESLGPEELRQFLDNAADFMMTTPTSAPDAAPLEQRVFHDTHPIDDTEMELAVSEIESLGPEELMLLPEMDETMGR